MIYFSHYFGMFFASLFLSLSLSLSLSLCTLSLERVVSLDRIDRRDEKFGHQ